MSFKQILSRNLLNIPGWRTNRKIVVIESDDWGSIRMLHRKNYDALIENGIRVDRSLYDSLDALENKSDLEFLGEVISKYKTKSDQYPLFTFNTVMGNPDFDKIKENDFRAYFWSPFYDSYQKYYDEDNRPVWNKLISEKLIQPQFHAKEHLNVSLWMGALQKNHEETRIAFDHDFFALKTDMPAAHQSHYLCAYHNTSEKDLQNKIQHLREGLDEFENVFGFKSKTFIACNYVWPIELEKVIKNEGIEMIQGQRGHIAPNKRTGEKRILYHYTGQENKGGQIYLVRNCLFEPYLDDRDWVNSCMKDIKRSFFWGKPAIICTHRINYVSGMSIKHRDSSLNKLDRLLKAIIKRWPDVYFMSSDQLGRTIQNE